MRLVACLILCVAARAAASPRVVIISVDGLRADAITQDVTPRLVAS